MSKLRTLGLSTTALAALALAGGAAAQSPPASDSAQAPATPSNAATESGVADIVITAQRRAENVQKAALSIVAISGEALAKQGVVDAQTLNNIVPGLKITYTGSQVQTFVRGVGDVSANAYTQSSVSLNMDGVYLARSSAFGPVFFDTARVEVLRGPQGTLYGRNSSGGAINVISNGPDLSRTSGYASIEAGNYQLLRAQTAVNLPVSDSFGVRAAAQITRRDGYSSDGSNDDKSEAGRLRALWKPTGDITVNIIGEAAHVGGRGDNRVFRPALFGDPWTGPNDSRITAALFPALRVRNDNSQNIHYYGVSSQVDWNLGGATLTILPAYKFVDVDGNIGGDFLSAEYDHSKQTSLEARLSGNGGRLKWVVGAFAFHEDLSVYGIFDQRAAATLTGQYQIQDIRKLNTGAWAGFGEATFSLTDRFRIIGGARYTEETRKRDGQIVTIQYTAGVAEPAAILPLVDQRLKVNATTWRGGVEYDVAPANMAYATVSRGFKSGGFDATDLDPYQPEYVTAYTVGLKNRFFDNTLQVNLEGFYWKYKNQQIAFLGLDSRGIVSFLTRNAGQSTISGADVDIVWRPTHADTLSAGLEYLHTNYNDFRYTTVGVAAAGTVLPDGCVSDGAPAGGGAQYIENCSGHPLPRAPKFTANARYTHSFALKHDDDITVGGTIKHDSLAYLAPNYADPYFRQNAYELYDADITYNAPGKHWSLQIYVRNITNKAVYQSASTETSIAPTTGATRGAFAAIGQPRTFGARAQVNF